MKNRTKIILGVGTLILLIMAAILFIYARQSTEYDEYAKKIAPYLPEYTVKEIEENLKTEAGEEKYDQVTDIIGEVVWPEVGEPIESDDPDDSTITYYDTSGHLVSVEKDYRIEEKTEEELAKFIEEELAEINKMVTEDDYISPIDDGDENTDANGQPIESEDPAPLTEEEREQLNKDMPTIPGANVINNDIDDGLTPEERSERVRNGGSQGYTGEEFGY